MLGDGGVGKTALAIQVRHYKAIHMHPVLIIPPSFLATILSVSPVVASAFYMSPVTAIILPSNYSEVCILL